ncbi:MAG: ABC transporter permease [Prevotellaceae bacterium]|jgi:lipoprotein-releasing system permease protein|nr:ABC transporter permease [Prevotellaceae bacterium]
MNSNIYIAKHITAGTRLSRLMARIAIVSVAVGVAVMITAVAVVTGFKSEISNKAVGFNGHLTLTNYDFNRSFETTPIQTEDAFIPSILAIEGVTHTQIYATKGGIIKTADAIQGAMLKGISSDFDWTFFRSSLVAGDIFNVSDTAVTNAVVLSKRLAALLDMNVGDAFEMYFIQEPPRVRKFTVAGLYDAQLEELDKVVILCDIAHIRRLNGWKANQVTGVEIFVKDLSCMDAVAEQVNELAAFHITGDGNRLRVRTVRDYFSNLFDWLSLLDLNVAIILTLMIIVAGFNMVSGLLILLFEKISMIGLLKALGMQNAQVQKVFLYRAAFILVKGLLWGNVAGIGLCLLQQYFGIVTLDPDNYFMSVAPVALNFLPVLAITVCSFAGVMLMLALPALFITRISPEKAMRVE